MPSPPDPPPGEEGPAARRSCLETQVHPEWESHRVEGRKETYPPPARVNLNISTRPKVENTVTAEKINLNNGTDNVSRV